MALTITEQRAMIAGTVKPPSNLLIDLVYQAAINHAYDFNSATIPPGYKVFATKNTTAPNAAINEDATNYVSKMLHLCARVFSKDQIVINALTVTVVAIIGKSAATFAQVQAANDATWETTILANMPRAFELISGVTKAELANYTTPVAAA